MVNMNQPSVLITAVTKMHVPERAAGHNRPG